MRSLFVGAISLALVAGAAIAEEVYQGVANQPSKESPAYKLPPKGTMDFAQRSVDPAIFDPSRPLPYHPEVGKSADIQPIGKPAESDRPIALKHSVSDSRHAEKTGPGS